MTEGGQSVSRESTEADVSLKHAEEAIIHFLTDRDEPVENLMLLSIAVREHECNRRDVQSAQLPLPEVHKHVTSTYLPNLARDGSVKYDRVNGTVTLNASPDGTEELLHR